ncbi:MAG: hypothetical protein U9N02_09245 [Campylobacterota bacterium]|nr:hypothetical protein [Campylobacterota bacterium]
MKKLLNFLFLFILFIISFIVFFPKDKLYFLLEKELLNYNITIKSQSMESNPFNFKMKNSTIYLSGAEVAKVNDFTISLLGININNIKPASSFKDMIPNIDNVKINYKTGDFLDITSKAGKAIGNIDLDNNNLTIKIKPEKNQINKYSKLLRELKKDGENYVFKYNF